MEALEKVLAVPAASMTKLVPMGLTRVDEQKFLNFVSAEGKFYDRTAQLEEDTSLKQLIPYIVASCGESILLCQRTKKQTEARLHSKYSLGFGGHVNPEDASDGVHPVIGGRQRELTEEVSLTGNVTFTFMGILNIAKMPVDRFHVGVVYLATVTSPEFSFHEKDKFTGDWATPAQMAEKYPLMEAWSQEVFATLYPKLVPASV